MISHSLRPISSFNFASRPLKYNQRSIRLMSLMIFAFLPFLGFGQTLSISDNGQTGTSGTNWSASGANPTIITATGTVDINTSVIQGYLDQGLSVEIRNTASGGTINVENPITKSAGGDATLTIRANRRIFVDNSHITSTSGKTKHRFVGPRFFN